MSLGIDSGTLRGLLTLVLLLLFVGIWVWAWSGKRKNSFDKAAQLPLDDVPPQARRHNHPQQDKSQQENEVEALRDE